MYDRLFTHLSGYFSLIQEEKESTEQRAEELESRVGSGTLEVVQARGGAPATWRPPGAPATAPTPAGATPNNNNFDRPNSPLSGRSTPTPHYQTISREQLQKYHAVGILLYWSVIGQCTKASHWSFHL